jgi:hypothetical protein
MAGLRLDGIPGVYERVSSYICWLNENTGQTLGSCQVQPPFVATNWIFLPVVVR